MIDKTGGPAYPVFPETGNGHAAAHQGMTLLDHFAGLAMQHMQWEYGEVESDAEWCYEVAAAMLKARAKHLESDND